jgi:hypothetical protein
MDVELTESFIRPKEHKSDGDDAAELFDLDRDSALDHGSSEAGVNAAMGKQQCVLFPISPGLRRRFGTIVNSVFTKLFVFVLIICDALILISETIVSDDYLDDTAVEVTTQTIIGFLVLEVIFRMVHQDVAFFKDIWYVRSSTNAAYIFICCLLVPGLCWIYV